MPIAAVPKYLGEEFKEASPALRFSLLLPIWTDPTDQEKEVRGREKKEQEVRYENKTDALKQSTRLTKTDKEANESLAARQSCMANTLSPAQLLRLDAHATAPFTTGLGNEHPLENGFAFLNPYGLPYLPGSGVKGVLRQAAQELASGQWGDTRGWSEEHHYRINVGTQKNPRQLGLSLLDVLFGREAPAGDADHVRGALTFWDVIPQIKDESLMVEIMTPHQSHYYQQKKEKKWGDSITPHDSGQPTPICFLTVPPGSTFTFHVVCDEQHLRRLTRDPLDGAPDLLASGEHGKPRWQTLLEAAFHHAFEWLGFGAKTAVGYGAMKIDTTAQERKPTAARPRSSWVDQKLQELCSKPGIKPDDALRGPALAEAVRAIEDQALRAQALADIVARWKEKGWWDHTSGGAAKKAKAIYEELLKASS